MHTILLTKFRRLPDASVEVGSKFRGICWQLLLYAFETVLNEIAGASKGAICDPQQLRQTESTNRIGVV